MTEITPTYTATGLGTSIEAILFAAGVPVLVTQLCEALGCTLSELETALIDLEHDLNQGRGIRLQRFAGKVQLTTAPEFSVAVETFLGLDATSRLSRAALETLSIVAYKNPITRPAIDAIRGVNSDGVLKSLLIKGLIEEVGRTEGPGRPILYGITSLFLQHFGLGSLSELPELEIEEPGYSNGLLKD